MRRLFAAGLVCAIVVTPAGAQEEGEHLFNGSGPVAGSVAVGGTTLAQPVSRFACRSCHGRDGSGGTEAKAPIITWSALSQPTAVRQGYDARSFRRALAEGRRSDGAELDTVMPRYALPDDVLENLMQYLTVLPAMQRNGIGAHDITFGVAIPPDNREPAQRFLAFVREARIPALFGRDIHFTALEGSADSIVRQAREGVAAVVGLVPSRVLSVDDFADANVPVLFPLALLDGDEDSSIVRGMIASRTQQLAQLVARTASDGHKRPAIVCTGGRPCLETVEAVAPDDRLDGFDALIVTGDDADETLRLLARVDPSIPVYAIAGEVPELVDAVRARGLSLTLADGYRERASADLLESHARWSAAALAQVLRWSGRSLTRAKLAGAVDRRGLPEFGLDYARYTLTGTDNVHFLHMPANQ